MHLKINMTARRGNRNYRENVQGNFPYLPYYSNLVYLEWEMILYV